MASRQGHRDDRAAEVLVVDDDDDLRLTLAEVLALHGFTVEALDSGPQALEYLRNYPAPRVVLVDLMMPVMDGAEFILRMRTVPGLTRVRVFVITASAAADESRLLALGASGLLRKPIDLKALLAILQQAT